MRLPFTALVLCRLARGFSPAQGTSRLRGLFGPAGLRTSTHSLTTSTTTTTTGITPSLTKKTSRGDARSMVLRPDWERDGRVFGFKPPTKKDRAFEYLVEYPCDFQIKVIGLNDGTFAADIAATVSVACEVEVADVRFTVRDTSSGKYQSVTVHAPVKSANMLYRCYERIDEDPRVKFKF